MPSLNTLTAKPCGHNRRPSPSARRLKEPSKNLIRTRLAKEPIAAVNAAVFFTIPILFVFVFIRHLKTGMPVIVLPIIIVCQLLFFAMPIMYSDNRLPIKLKHLIYQSAITHTLGIAYFYAYKDQLAELV